MSKNIDMNRINQPIASGRNAKWSYVSLLFSLFYFFPLVVIAPTQSVGHLFLIISIYALFLVAFFMSASRCGKAALLPILSMIAVAVVGTFVYAGTNVFYGYSSYFASYYYKAKQAFALGVKAFVLKEAPIEYLVNCLIKVKKGQRVVDPELALMALDDTDPLTEKERKALKLASEGIKTSDIAKRLYLSEGTVRNYLSEAIAKLNAMNRVDAARIAMQKGWI